MRNTAITWSHIISSACFFCLGKENAYIRALFTFSGLYQAHIGCLSKVIYWKLIIIGSHVTVGTPRERSRSVVCLGAFGKMSGSGCRCFLPLPHHLPRLLFRNRSQFSSPSHAFFGKGKETAATQATTEITHTFASKVAKFSSQPVNLPGAVIKFWCTWL